MLQKKVGSGGRCTFEEIAVIRSRGGEGASWKGMENAGERPVHTRNVGVFSCEKLEAKKFLEDAEKEKKGTRPMAT